MYIYIFLRGLVYKCIDIGYLNDKIFFLVIFVEYVDFSLVDFIEL